MEKHFCTDCRFFGELTIHGLCPRCASSSVVSEHAPSVTRYTQLRESKAEDRRIAKAVAAEAGSCH